MAPADQFVLDAPVRQLTMSTGRVRLSNRRSRLLIAFAGAVAVAAAGAVVLPGVIGTRLPVRGQSTPAQSTPAQLTPPRSGPVTVGAILTAFVASSSDILQVTKTMAGTEGSLGKTIIWIDPVGAGRGTAVQSRILLFSLAGARQVDLALRYAQPRSRPAGCDEFFERPKLAVLHTAGLPGAGPRGTLAIVYYSQRIWGRAPVAVQAATVPSADSLRACLRPAYWREFSHGVLGGTKTTEFASAVWGLPGYEHLWVDSATFLPVRLVSFNGEERITFGFRFLPPTPANKARLRLRTPVGFVRRRL